MVTVTMLAVGKLKEPFYQAAVAEYQKRLAAFCRLQITELPETRLPENPATAQIGAGLQKESAAILERIPKGAWVCVLTPEGKLLSSPQLADRLAAVKLSGKSGICLILGGSFGLDPAVKARADLLLSMSPMTFPHHLARVMVLEQLYRAESIQAGTRYHK